MLAPAVVTTLHSSHHLCWLLLRQELDGVSQRALELRTALIAQGMLLPLPTPDFLQDEMELSHK